MIMLEGDQLVFRFDEIHEAQCLNYLKATELPICLLINFGRPKVEIKRFPGKSAKFTI